MSKRVLLRKAQPTVSGVHVNAPLTNISVAYIQSAANFVADKAFPVVPVTKRSDLYYRYDREDFLRDEARERAPATQSAGGGFALDTDNYYARVYAFHKDVDDQTRANADSVLQLDQAATLFVTQKMLIRREKQWVSQFFTDSVWGTDVSGVTGTPTTGQFKKWNESGSTPRADIDVAKDTVVLGSAGLEANTLVIGRRVLSALRSNADVRDQFKYVSAESIDTAMLARYFGVERVLVTGAVYEASAEGAVTASPAFIAGNHVLVCHTAPAPSLMTPSAGYIFSWTELGGSGVRIKKFRKESIESDRIEGQMAFDMKRVAPALGYFLKDAV